MRIRGQYHHQALGPGHRGHKQRGQHENPTKPDKTRQYSVRITLMPATPNEPEFSSIEDLDPEPQPKGSRANTREFLLGILLVLVVLGWGGWTWAQQESKQTDYREAQQAAANRDWDQARAHYAAAAGYKDANAQLVEIDKLIAQRNRWYTAAARDAGKRDW